jgi:CheY-like chemotaxis protein
MVKNAGRHIANPFETAPRLRLPAGRMIDRGVWRVLIVEDERVGREIYKGRLRHSTPFQFEFAESDSAAAAIEMSNRWAPDSILLDFNLSSMDGLKVLRRLRRRKKIAFPAPF